MLTGLHANFSNIRQSGLKAIIRFSYNQGSDSTFPQDASKAQILRHIEQLTPLLQQNADVIAWMEAGFIGEWGEWHSSTNGLDNIQDKREILSAILEALPETRMVQLRYPSDILTMFPQPADAWKARVGHHNDCFLSSNTDMGTYEQNGIITRERDLVYLSDLTRLTPMSGETCAPDPPRSECGNAIKELALLHFSALSADYHQDVLRSWRERGCFQEINHRLGYRLILTSADFNEQIPPGGMLRLTVNLQNNGFAPIINRYPLYVVLKSSAGTSPYLLKLNLDPRDWEPGKARFSVKLYIPSSVPEDTYQLALWLPDEYESLGGNPLYAVHFANTDTWDKKTGYNVLGSVTVTEKTPGTSQSSEEFKVLDLISLSKR